MRKHLPITIFYFCALVSHAQTVAPHCPPQPNGADNWDWRQPNFNFYLAGANYTGPNSPNGEFTMESPFQPIDRNNNNINKFQVQSLKDFEPEAGWVLVQRDFGTASKRINHPYFILYNKYSGILRIFVAISTAIGQNDRALITLKYAEGRRSAILELLSPNNHVNALTDFDNQVPEIIVANDYAFDLPYWLHADFVMNYDPCTCDVNSQLFFDVRLVQTNTLTFKLNGTAVPQMDKEGRKGDGKQGFSQVTEGIKTIVDGGVSYHASAKSGLSMLQEIFPSISFAENPWWNALTGLGGAAGVVTKLVGVFTNTPNASEPVAFDINLKGNGEITWSGSHKQIIMSNPGSVLIPPTIINYKNIMGVFTLLEPPKLNVVISGAFSPIFIDGAFYDVTLAENLKYAINPNAGFDLSNSTITAAYVYERSAPPNFSYLKYFTNMNYVNDSTLVSSFVPISLLTTCKARAAVHHASSSNPFPNGSILPPTVYLKVTAILRKTDANGVLHEAVFIAKYKTQIVSTTKLTIPSSSPSTPPYSDWVEVTPSWGGSSGRFNSSFVRYGSKSVTLFGNYTTTSGAQATYLSDNTLRIIGGTNSAIGAGITMKVASGNGSANVPETDPTPYCINSNYISKRDQFLRKGSHQTDSSKMALVERQTTAEKRTTAFPNPTTGKVSFRYYVEEPSQVRLNLVSTTGTVVATPIDAYQEAGPYEFGYDASNLPAGIYIYTLETSKGKETKRLVVIK
jgi:hypothetical protein